MMAFTGRRNDPSGMVNEAAANMDAQEKDALLKLFFHTTFLCQRRASMR